MALSPEQIRADLNVVYTFHVFLLENALGHEVPVPQQVAQDPAALRRFVSVLEMAITPQMVRDGLKTLDQKPAAEALLRFYAEKSARRREDRDKIDVIATALFRFLYPGEEPAVGDNEETERVLAFEQELRRICAALEMSPPPPEHLQLVREFQFLRDEVTDFRRFDELIDSGIIQKVRDIKQSLRGSFLHPAVLAPIAAYNVYFGYCFDKLFRQAAHEVKSFAAKVQQEGGSIMSRVDGDVIVKNLTDVDETRILNEEYNLAQEDLRYMSKLKKAVDNRRYGKTAAPAPAASQPAPGRAPAQPPRPAAAPAPKAPSVVPLAEQVGNAPATPSFHGFSGGSGTPTFHGFPGANSPPTPTFGPGMSQMQATPRSSINMGSMEEQRLVATLAAIRSFVQSSDPESGNVVPLPQGSITLLDNEVEAFRTGYGNERSFRADYAALLMQLVALDARLMAEMQGFLKTQKTLYNWKPHADTIALLLTYSSTVYENATLLISVAQQRGLADKVVAINASLDKLRGRCREAAAILQSIESQP